MASGKPFRPSITATRISFSPRWLSSFMTPSQNFAPSLCCIQMPSTSLVPSRWMPKARYTALFLTVPSSRILTLKASKNTTAYIGSKGRFCHSITSSRTESVTVLLNHRGLKDILVAVIDGLKGFPEAISAVYPDSEIQTCIVHLIRNSLSFCNWKDRKPVAAELKKIYNAVPGILATHRPGAIMDKSGRQFVARSDWGANAPLRTQRAKIFSQLLTKRKPGPHTQKPTLLASHPWHPPPSSVGCS